MDSTIEEFELECLIRGFSSGYSRDVRLEVGALARWLGGGLLEVDTGTLKTYIAHLITTPARNKETPRSGSTVYRIVSRLKAFYRWLEETEQIPESPMKGIRGPRHRDRLIEPLTQVEVARIMAGARTGRSPVLATRNYAMVVLALDSGLRLSEMLQLNREQAEGDTLTVVGKGGKTRTVALNPLPRSAIAEMVELRWDSNPALFVDQDGARLTRSGARFLLYRLKQKVRIAGLHWHNLRHTALTAMTEAGISIFALKEIAGHEKITTTERYVHAAGRRMAVAAHREFSPTAG